MIVQNLALRLYWVPKESQLLKRLGGAWYVPKPEDPPLPVPIRSSVKTTLRELADRVPTQGTCIDKFPEIPPSAPTWDGRVHAIPKQTDWDYEVAANALTSACQNGTLVNIFCNGIRTNKGREDEKQLGAMVAVLYSKGEEHCHTTRILGEMVTGPDTIMRSLQAGLDALIFFVDNLTTRQINFVTIALPSSNAMDKALDMSPHEDQEESIIHLKKISAILNSHPNTKIILLWLPANAPSVGFQRARQLTLETARMANTTEIIELHTIGNQRKVTKDVAIATWAEKWHQMPHTSKAYRTALTTPPDGKPHLIFNLTPTPKNPGEPRIEALAKFSRLTHSTLFRLVTGHAFTGEYTQCFFLQHIQEQIACHCGEPLQTAEHVLFHCPLYSAAHRRHLTVNGHPRSFPQLLENPKHAQLLLRFLEETRACSKPQAEWEPGWSTGHSFLQQSHPCCHLHKSTTLKTTVSFSPKSLCEAPAIYS